MLNDFYIKTDDGSFVKGDYFDYCFLSTSPSCTFWETIKGGIYIVIFFVIITLLMGLFFMIFN